MLGNVGEAARPRSTASQMQRGSGELQSTPTGFWKLQSGADVGAGPGSRAAGIWECRSLTSAFLPAHMSQSRDGGCGGTGGEEQSVSKKRPRFFPRVPRGTFSPLGFSGLSSNGGRFPVPAALRHIVDSNRKKVLVPTLLFTARQVVVPSVSPSATEDL